MPANPFRALCGLEAHTPSRNHFQTFLFNSRLYILKKGCCKLQNAVGNGLFLFLSSILLDTITVKARQLCFLSVNIFSMALRIARDDGLCFARCEVANGNYKL